MASKAPWRACLASLLSALLVPASYSSLAVAAHACRNSSPGSVVLLLLLLPLLLYGLCCRPGRNRFCAVAPAYAHVLGHFATALFTHVVKLFPVVSAGLSTAFYTFSLLLSFLFIRVISSDPGYVTSNLLDKEHGYWRESNRDKDSDPDGIEGGGGEVRVERAKYCHYCHAFIERYDHHCAAVQNCIGRNNHKLFLLLMVAFSLAEILYVLSCISYLRRFAWSTVQKIEKGHEYMSSDRFQHAAWKMFSKEAWLLSTTFFVGFQILWQIPLLVFQVYLIAVNLTTDEWLNWEKYSLLYEEASPTNGGSYQRKKFVNPYNQGILRNILAMLQKWK